MTAPRVYIPILNPDNRAFDYEAEIAEAVPALGISAGQAVTLRPMAKPDCDCLYLLPDGSFCRLQFWIGKALRKVDAAGTVEIVPMVSVQIAARIVRLSAAA